MNHQQRKFYFGVVLPIAVELKLSGDKDEAHECLKKLYCQYKTIDRDTGEEIMVTGSTSDLDEHQTAEYFTKIKELFASVGGKFPETKPNRNEYTNHE